MGRQGGGGPSSRGRFRHSADAVSATTGTILLVGITAALAALVFLIAPRTSEVSDSVPAIGFARDDEADGLRILAAPSGHDWGQVRAAVQCEAGSPRLMLNGADVPLVGGVADPVDPAGAPLQGGFDILEPSCAGAPLGSKVTLTLAYKPANAMLGAPWTFGA
jgi:hypothetical protein